MTEIFELKIPVKLAGKIVNSLFGLDNVRVFGTKMWDSLLHHHHLLEAMNFF